MMKPVNLPLIGRVDTKGLLIGMAVLALLMVAPIPSNPIVAFVTSIRDKISSYLGGK